MCAPSTASTRSRRCSSSTRASASTARCASPRARCRRSRRPRAWPPRTGRSSRSTRPGPRAPRPSMRWSPSSRPPRASGATVTPFPRCLAATTARRPRTDAATACAVSHGPESPPVQTASWRRMEATTADRAPSGGSPVANRLDRYFDITARGSSIPTEVRGGAATFLTMAYILFVNPQILGSVAAPGGVKLPFDQLLTVTALVAAVATLAMGIYGRYPFALASGLGINAFVAFSLVGADRLSWPDAMGVIVAEGLVITALVLVGFREAVINAIPHDLKLAIGIGIGLFITIIGLVDAGIVIKGTGTVVTLAPKLNTWPIAIFVLGLFGTYALVARRVRGALLYGIIGTTVLATV